MYALLVSVHVVVGILGLGQIAGLLVVAHTKPVEETWTSVARLVRGISWSLLAMIASGALIEYRLGGPFHGAWWFRISFLLALVVGALAGTLRRALAQPRDARLLARIRARSWAMCIVVATVTVLMEVKPW